ncbi:gamma-glutamyltransferase family protein [Halalkalicoccus tibetensis]|uniref:Gamma-glutamyltransferase family protein n=1 Tax=Halalkalicoccus tibetensis TaxID=175632 RepID=A0ABD5V583_9EURY
MNGSNSNDDGILGANAPDGDGIGAADRTDVSPDDGGRFDYPWQFIGRRSAVMARNGMVATSHPLAAQTGLQVLREGGNAVDAAVATAVELNLVEPHMTTIGGDVTAMVHFDGEFEGLNASGPAPAGADVETYRERTDESEDGTPTVPTEGPLAVTVPGALDGLHELAGRYGSREFGELLRPTIEHAREGVAVTEYVASQWETAAPRVDGFESFRETFLEDGQSPPPGAVFENPAFADSLERIAEEGIGTFYGGELGEEIVELVQDHDGLLELSDLEEYESEWVDPISTTYRGLEVLELPPNTVGPVALEALNIVENFDLPAEPTDPERLHRLIEAIKIAYTDAHRHIGDPDLERIPLETKLSKEYAGERAAQIEEEVGDYEPRAGEMSAMSEEGDTVYLTVVDGDGNAVSMLKSGYKPFGSGLTVGGFTLQNHAAGFTLEPGDPNVIEPGKRPFHTLIPAMLREDGDFRASFGVMGGRMMPQGHLQLLANMADSELNPQAAIDVPRFRFQKGHEVALETTRMPDETVEELRERGHEVIPEAEFFVPDADHYGGAQFIYRDDEGTLIGGSEPRRDGHAVGF